MLGYLGWSGFEQPSSYLQVDLSFYTYPGVLDNPTLLVMHLTNEPHYLATEGSFVQVFHHSP